MTSPFTIPPVSDSNAWNIRFNTMRRSSSIKLNGIIYTEKILFLRVVGKPEFIQDFGEKNNVEVFWETPSHIQWISQLVMQYRNSLNCFCPNEGKQKEELPWLNKNHMKKKSNFLLFSGERGAVFHWGFYFSMEGKEIPLR